MKKGIIIDILCVIAVTAAIVGFGARFLTNAAKDAKGEVALSYVVEIEGVRMYSVDALNQKGTLYNVKDKSVMGEITAVEYTSATSDEVSAFGSPVKAEVPDKYNVLVTVDAIGKENANDYFIGGNVELSVGTTLSMTTKYVNTSGKVISIEKK